MAGVPWSGYVNDTCQVCGGDNATCAGCDGESAECSPRSTDGARPAQLTVAAPLN
eukprot:COSAG01_NODE_1576_length_9855_cov_32.477962_2_plen_55_part_00